MIRILFKKYNIFNIKKFKTIFLFFFVFILFPFIINAETLNINSSVTISATVSSSGGGSGSISIIDEGLGLPTIVNFSGIAPSFSKVYLLKDGNVVASTISDLNSNFSISLSNLTTNTYIFSLYAEDSKGKKSPYLFYNIFISSGTITSIGNISLFPMLEIYTQSEKKQCLSSKGDLNCDGRINYLDFLLMLFWYKNPNPPLKIDLNADGKITLIDFSIMVFNWTGWY